MIEKLLSEEQTAHLLGWKHVKTLAKKRLKDEIALRYVVLPGGKIGYRPSDVERYIELCTVEPSGSGRLKKKKEKVKVPKGPFIFMTNEEAQEFFQGLEIEDGMLICKPED